MGFLAASCRLLFELSTVDGVLSLSRMCGWSHTRGTWGGLFFPKPVEEVFDRHDIILSKTGACIFLYSDTCL